MEVVDVNIFTVKVNSYYEIEGGLKKNHISYVNKALTLRKEMDAYFSDPSNEL
jgi:hypothetical protein